jgi:hypothetical protein
VQVPPNASEQRDPPAASRTLTDRLQGPLFRAVIAAAAFDSAA